MPFYEYECSSCRYYAEVMQKITDTPLKKCPSCGQTTFKKLISAPVFRLKGSGWYETDFKSDQDNKRNLAGGDKEEAASKADSKSESESKSESKTDAKADTKADAKSDAKSGGKGETTAPAAGPKTPAPTRRNITARAAHGKSAAKRARPAKRKAAKRRGGR